MLRDLINAIEATVPNYPNTVWRLETPTENLTWRVGATQDDFTWEFQDGPYFWRKTYDLIYSCPLTGMTATSAISPIEMDRIDPAGAVYIVKALAEKLVRAGPPTGKDRDEIRAAAEDATRNCPDKHKPDSPEWEDAKYILETYRVLTPPHVTIAMLNALDHLENEVARLQAVINRMPPLSSFMGK
jgi:hypothetical protein